MSYSYLLQFNAGTFREMLCLSSSCFFLLDDGLGFRLVPWASSLEKYRDQQISGIARSDGGIDWRRERERGLGALGNLLTRRLI